MFLVKLQAFTINDCFGRLINLMLVETVAWWPAAISFSLFLRLLFLFYLITLKKTNSKKINDNNVIIIKN